MEPLEAAHSIQGDYKVALSAVRALSVTSTSSIAQVFHNMGYTPDMAAWDEITITKYQHLFVRPAL